MPEQQDIQPGGYFVKGDRRFQVLKVDATGVTLTRQTGVRLVETPARLADSGYRYEPPPAALLPLMVAPQRWRIGWSKGQDFVGRECEVIALEPRARARHTVRVRLLDSPDDLFGEELLVSPRCLYPVLESTTPAP